jgi:hypothetical protein
MAAMVGQTVAEEMEAAGEISCQFVFTRRGRGGVEVVGKVRGRGLEGGSASGFVDRGKAAEGCRSPRCWRTRVCSFGSRCGDEVL